MANRICSIDDCTGKHYGKGYCQKHYMRLHTTGTTDLLVPTHRACSIDGCNTKHEALGYCTKHYQRVKAHNDPHFQRKSGDDNARFDSHIDKSGDCWLWTSGVSSNGYGGFSVRSKSISAHVFAYRRAHGPVPDGLQVRHSCHNRLCVNPAHLSVGTAADNAQDKVDADRHCYGERNGEAKLAEAEVQAILADDRTQCVIAEQYSVAQATVSNIKCGTTWKHVTDNQGAR